MSNWAIENNLEKRSDHYKEQYLREKETPAVNSGKNNNLKLPNKFQLMDIDEVIYEFENKFGTLVGTPSISKDTDWTWKDLERWAALRTIPNGYPSTLKRLAYLDMTEWSWEAQLVIRRGMSPLDNYWLRFHDTETFDNLPHTRSKNHPPMPDTPGIVIFKK